MGSGYGSCTSQQTHLATQPEWGNPTSSGSHFIVAIRDPDEEAKGLKPSAEVMTRQQLGT